MRSTSCRRSKAGEDGSDALDLRWCERFASGQDFQIRPNPINSSARDPPEKRNPRRVDAPAAAWWPTARISPVGSRYGSRPFAVGEGHGKCRPTVDTNLDGGRMVAKSCSLYTFGRQLIHTSLTLGTRERVGRSSKRVWVAIALESSETNSYDCQEAGSAFGLGDHLVIRCVL